MCESASRLVCQCLRCAICVFFGQVQALGRGVAHDQSVAEIGFQGDVLQHRPLVSSFGHLPRSSKNSEQRILRNEGHRLLKVGQANLATSLSEERSRIPSQLILMGRNDSFESVHMKTRKSIERILKESPRMRMRWFGDKACASYLLEHYDAEIVGFFNAETRGSLRGDICRTAVLLREGGFYIDLDVVLVTPLHALVDNATTFMSAFEYPEKRRGGILNAVIAAEPGSAVLNSTLAKMRSWYHHEAKWMSALFGHMGPITLMRGLVARMHLDCPREDLEVWKEKQQWMHPPLQKECGPHVLRLYVQKKLDCSRTGDKRECSDKRKMARTKYPGADFGIFAPGPERKLIGYPRPEWCEVAGCNLGGSDVVASPKQAHMTESSRA